MRRCFLRVCGGCLALSLCLLVSGCFGERAALRQKTVLKINSTEISTEEFAQRLAIQLKQFDALQVKEGANLRRLKEQTIQALILEVITKDFAKEKNLTVSRAEIDGEVAKVQSKYPDDLSFKKALADENIAFDKWKSDLEFNILQKKVFADFAAKIPEPSESEMKSFYDSNKTMFQTPARIRLRQIVLAKEDDARRIMVELNSGGKLEELARKYSVAPEAEKGGDTGWLDKGTLEVFDTGFKMNPGTRSKILKSPYGYHIFEVVKKEPEGRLSFQDAKGKIRAQLTEKKEQSLFSAWLEEQVRKTHVSRNEALIQAIQVSTRGSY